MSGLSTNLLGVGLSVLAALLFAVQYIFLRLGTRRASAMDVVLVTLATNVAIVGPLALLVHGLPSMSTEAALAFVGAGIAGSLLGRVCMFQSVKAIGASRTSPVVAGNVFFATILAVLIFGEGLTVFHGIGIVLIVLGVGYISWETAQGNDPGESIDSYGPVLLLPVLAALFIGIEPIFIRIGFEAGGAVLPGVAIKVTAALCGFLIVLLIKRDLGIGRIAKAPELRWYLGAGVTGTFGLVALFAALEVAAIVIVVPLLQTVPLIVMILSVLVLPRRLERVSWRLVSAAMVVVIGAVIVSVQ